MRWYLTWNLYELYERNGYRAGFWVRKVQGLGRSQRLYVKTVQGRTSGPLKGRSPYYGNCSVIADVYCLATGEVTLDREWAMVAGFRDFWPWTPPETMRGLYPADDTDHQAPPTAR